MLFVSNYSLFSSGGYGRDVGLKARELGSFEIFRVCFGTSLRSI